MHKKVCMFTLYENILQDTHETSQHFTISYLRLHTFFSLKFSLEGSITF